METSVGQNVDCPSALHMRHCLAHSGLYRQRLEFVVNSLRRTGRLAPKYANMIGAIVCSCKEQKHDLHPFWTDDNRIRRTVQEYHEKKGLPLDSGEATTRSAFEILNAFPNIDRGGLEKFIVLLIKISNQDFTFFTNCRENRESDPVVYRVSLSSRYAGLLVGKGGRTLGPIRQATGCGIWLIEGDEDWACADYLALKINGPCESVKTACKLLDIKAAEIKTKRKHHEENLKKNQEILHRRRMKSLLERSKVIRSGGVIEDFKKWNLMEYSRQRKGTKRPQSAKAKGHRLLAEGSRCLNCLAPFKPEGVSGKCRFHRGYIVGDVWSCCETTSDSHPTHTDHVTTGCATSIHNYRPTKRRSGKNNLNSAKESASGLLREGADTLMDLKKM